VIRARSLSALALTPTLVALSLVPAAADAHPKHDGFSAADGWSVIDDKLAIPAGEVCSGKVVFHYWGHERTLLKGEHGYEPVTDPEFVPQAGDRTKAESADSQFTLKAVRSGRKVHRDADGEFYEKVTRNGENLKSVGVGANIYFGPGIKGILWADGVQKFRVANFMENPVLEHFRIKRGKAQELCHRVGLRPVDLRHSDEQPELVPIEHPEHVEPVTD
jgi:hypothetical protein